MVYLLKAYDRVSRALVYEALIGDDRDFAAVAESLKFDGYDVCQFTAKTECEE